SPLRHCFVTFEVKAPLFVARQWWRYIVASAHAESTPGWSEASRRYITMEPEFYVPDIWRKAPENKKQGSGGVINDEALNAELRQRLQRIIDAGLEAYEFALEAGVAPVQARLFLPAYGMYPIWRWSASLQSVWHFLSQRLVDDAQWEIRQYAEVVLHFVEKLFPVTTRAWLKYQMRWSQSSTFAQETGRNLSRHGFFRKNIGMSVRSVGVLSAFPTQRIQTIWACCWSHGRTSTLTRR